MHHTVVLSDVHLWNALPGDDLWMRYRQRRFFPDDEIAGVLDRIREAARGASIELVFNGDVFDFDVAPVVNGALQFGDPPRSEADAAVRLAAILDEHTTFVDAVARYLAAGHRVVFVSGNHDAQLVFPAVRDVLLSRLVAAASMHGPSPDLEPERLRARVSFRTWFHRTADGIHVEHGHQYDRYCSFHDPTEPFASDRATIQRTVGSLVIQHIVGRLGYFNPNHDDSFLLSVPGYVRHFARFYLGTRRSLVGTWALGTLRVALSLWRDRERRSSTRAQRDIERSVAETGADPDALDAHARLFCHTGIHEFVRTLSLDKAALFAFGAGAIALTALKPRAGGLFALGTAATVAAFHVAVPARPLSEVYDYVRECQRQIAQIHGARAVVFGHTHEAYGEWRDGLFIGNCGTSSPRFRDVECTIPFERGTPVIWLRSEGERLEGGLYRLIGDELVAQPGGEVRETEPARLPAPGELRASVA